MVELQKARATDTPVCECTICCLGVSEWLYEMVVVRSHKVEGEIHVCVSRSPPMYRSHQTHEEVSPDVRKSAKLRERDRWVCGGFPQCTEVSRVKGNENQ